MTLPYSDYSSLWLWWPYFCFSGSSCKTLCGIDCLLVAGIPVRDLLLAPNICFPLPEGAEDREPPKESVLVRGLTPASTPAKVLQPPQHSASFAGIKRSRPNSA